MNDANAGRSPRPTPTHHQHIARPQALAVLFDLLRALGHDPARILVGVNDIRHHNGDPALGSWDEMSAADVARLTARARAKLDQRARLRVRAAAWARLARDERTTDELLAGCFDGWTEQDLEILVADVAARAMVAAPEPDAWGATA